MALLLNEIKDDNKEDMLILVQKQTFSIMEHMFQTFGVIALRNFKQYLLVQKLRNETEIQTLKRNISRVISLWSRVRKLPFYRKQPILSQMSSRYPQTLIQSMLNAMNNPAFTEFIL